MGVEQIQKGIRFDTIKSLKATIEQDKVEIRQREAQIEGYIKYIKEIEEFLEELKNGIQKP